MSIKLIVTDLDGTFLNSNHITIPKENIESFKKAHENGIKLAIASGRTKVLTDYIVPQLPFLDYLITSNGAVAYDLKNNDAICSTLIGSSSAIKIFNILNEFDIPFEIYFEGNCYMSESSYSLFDEKHISPHIYNLLKDFIKPVPDLTKLIDGKGVEKINIMSLTDEQRTVLEERISAVSQVAFASSFPKGEAKNGNLEMTNINATKGLAVKKIAENSGFGKENVMCFGDGENDCTMLSFADFSFAMKNGSDMAKYAAVFLTDTNDNGGVSKAINKYIFGE